MVKIALLRQYIPGRTFDYFRPEGYDIIGIIDVESDAIPTREDLQTMLDSKTRKPVKVRRE